MAADKEFPYEDSKGEVQKQQQKTQGNLQLGITFENERKKEIGNKTFRFFFFLSSKANTNSATTTNLFLLLPPQESEQISCGVCKKYKV